MSVTRTEEFLYFQHKARHYENLRKARPAIKTHRRYGTLQIPPRATHFQRYDMERANEGLISRLQQIMGGDRPEVGKQGYSRLNIGVHLASRYEIEKKRMEEGIDEGNQKLAGRMLKMKPSVGTISDWNNHYERIKEQKRKISKFTERGASKGVLDIYSSSTYMPEHYRSFLNQPLSGRQSSIYIGQSPEDLPSLNSKIRMQKLFQLPKLRRLRGSMTHIDGDKIDKIQ